MSDFHDYDPGERQPTPEQAFRAEHEFRGKKLRPYSFVRQTAATALGLRYGSLSEDEIRTHTNPKWKELRTKWEEAVADRERVFTAEEQEELNNVLAQLQDEPEHITLYDGLVMDAAIVLWLCSQPDSVCQKARRKPREFETAIDKWADENGVVMGSRYLAEATSLFAEIVQGVGDSRGEPDLESSQGESSPN